MSSAANREGRHLTVGREWGVDWALRSLTGNRKWHQQLCNSSAKEGGEGGRKEGAERGALLTLLFCFWVRSNSYVLLWVMFYEFLTTMPQCQHKRLSRSTAVTINQTFQRRSWASQRCQIQYCETTHSDVPFHFCPHASVSISFIWCTCTLTFQLWFKALMLTG